MMRVLHAVAAFFTMVLLFIRQRWAICDSCPEKQQQREMRPFPYGDSSVSGVPVMCEDCAECARAACFYQQCCQPKYKRDPDISIDNESIGQHPHDN